MNSTKTISVRIPMADYIEFLQDAVSKELSMNDWLLLKIYGKNEASQKKKPVGRPKGSIKLKVKTDPKPKSKSNPKPKPKEITAVKEVSWTLKRKSKKELSFKSLVMILDSIGVKKDSNLRLAVGKSMEVNGYKIHRKGEFTFHLYTKNNPK